MSDTVIYQDPELTFAADEFLDVIEDEKAGAIAGVSLWYAYSLRKAFECGAAWEQGHERADGPGEQIPSGLYFKDDLDGGRLVKKDESVLVKACRKSLGLLLARLDMADICDDEKHHIVELRKALEAV